MVETGDVSSPNPGGVLVEFLGCRLLVGCPPGAAADLARLGVHLADLDAVLLTCVSSIVGWPELWVSGGRPTGRRPRLLGTTPLLLAVEAHLWELADAAEVGSVAGPTASSRRGSANHFPLSAAEVGAALAAAEEASFRQEVTVEGPEGSIIVSPASSGYCLGGAYWVLEALGVRVGIVGPASLVAPLASQPFDRSMLANTRAAVVYSTMEAHSVSQVPAMIAANIDEGVRGVQARKCVLLPFNPDLALLIDIVEGLGQAIADLPDSSQHPMFVVGSPARLLRRCASFAEWAHPERTAHAHVGAAPFLTEALATANRIVLADRVHDLADSYREPCIVIASALPGGRSAVAHFKKRWASGVPAQRLVVDAATGVAEGTLGTAETGLPLTGRPVELRLRPQEVTELLSHGVLHAAVLPSGTKAPANLRHASELCCARRVTVPLDWHLPCAQCWIPRRILEGAGAAMAAAAADAGEAGSMGATSVCHLDGVVVGSKRPRIAAYNHASEGPSAPLLIGKVDVDALLESFTRRGCVDASIVCNKHTPGARGQSGGAITITIPSMKARMILNSAIEGLDTGLQTTVEAPSRKVRKLITEEIESLLMRL